MLADEGGVNGAGEAGPSAAGVELIRRDEERFARRDIDIDAFALLVPIVVVKGVLRSGMLRDSVLSGGEPTAQLFVRRLDIGIGLASDLEEFGGGYGSSPMGSCPDSPGGKSLHRRSCGGALPR